MTVKKKVFSCDVNLKGFHPYQGAQIMATERGKFIVLEGLDRAGKSLQCDKLVANLTKRGHKTLKMQFPDRQTAIGTIINQYLTQKSKTEINDEVIHLLFSANRWEAKNKILDTLNSGTSIVCDRYCYSGIAFSAAKGMDIEWCKACDKGLPEPDLVIFLDVDESTAMQRGGYGNERYETQKMQREVRQQFIKLREPSWKWINANGTIDEVENEIIDAVNQM